MMLIWARDEAVHDKQLEKVDLLAKDVLAELSEERRRGSTSLEAGMSLVETCTESEHIVVGLPETRVRGVCELVEGRESHRSRGATARKDGRGQEDKRRRARGGHASRSPTTSSFLE